MIRSLRLILPILFALSLIWEGYLLFQLFNEEFLNQNNALRIALNSILLLLLAVSLILQVNTFSLKFARPLLVVLAAAVLYGSILPTQFIPLWSTFLGFTSLIISSLLLTLIRGNSSLSKLTRFLILLTGIGICSGLVFELQNSAFFDALRILLAVSTLLTLFVMIYSLFTSRK